MTWPPWPPTHSPFEVIPCQHEDVYLPVHLLHLVEMGLTQGQNWVLDPLADDCAADGRYTLPARRHPAAADGGARHAPQPGRAQVARRRRAVAPPSTGPVRGRVASRGGMSAGGGGRPVTAQCRVRACVSMRLRVRMPQNSKP